MSNRDGKILIDQKAMEQKFEDRAWTKPSRQLDGSFSTPLEENQFRTFNEFLTFALIHEVKHDTIKKAEGETTGQYEDRINQAALTDLKENYNIAAKETAPEVRYKDKEKRLRIDYPAEIRTPNGDAFKSSDLIKASEVKFATRIAEENSIFGDYAKAIGKKYGVAAGNYAAITEGEISVPEAEFLRDNPEFTERFIDAFETDELGEAKTFQQYAQALLDQNEKLVDTAQMSLFDPNNEDLEDGDEPNPCGI
jgi:hypothetical protein